MQKRTLGRVDPTNTGNLQLTQPEQEMYDAIGVGCFIIDIPKSLYESMPDLSRKLTALETKGWIEKRTVDVRD
jgi:hypothetical protein